MKFAVAVVAVLALAGPLNAYKIPSTGSGLLAKELQDFWDLFPQDEAIQITKAYNAYDKQFKELLQLISGPEFKAYLEDVEKVPAFMVFVNYLQKAGVDAHFILKSVNTIFNIKSVNVSPSVQIAGGIVGYLKELAAIIPVQKVQNLHLEKVKTSKVYNDFLAEISSPKYQEILSLPATNEHFQNVLAQAELIGVDNQTLTSYYPILTIVKVILAKFAA